MKIQQIRNATLKITYMGSTFLVDPWLQDKGAGFSAPTVRPEMAGIKNPMNDLPFPACEILSGVGFCLITHIHPDHFTKDHIPPDMKIYVQNTADFAAAQEMGFTDVEEVPDAIQGMSVTKTPAVHGDNEGTAARMGQVHGYLLSGEALSLYIAGDTVFCDSVADVLKDRRPDVIALNCCAATLPSGRLIMDLADIDAVCDLAPEATIIATHLDSVNHSLLTRADVLEYVARKGSRQIKVPSDGEIIDFP